jgi:hypothetical protein
LITKQTRHLSAIPTEYDWAFYKQGDEVISEKYLPEIKKAMEDNPPNEKVQGLLFNYLHFFVPTITLALNTHGTEERSG